MPKILLIMEVLVTSSLILSITKIFLAPFMRSLLAASVVYKEQGAKQAGFDWHKDIATNGEITSITTIFGNATFQIRPEDKTSYSATYSLPLIPGSIVLLSGDSRWRWEHRVLSQETSTADSIGRISMVLGCQ